MSAGTVQNLEHLLARKSELATRSTGDRQFAARLRELQHWQTSRLARTYRDLKYNPSFAPAIDFFLSDLYGSRPFSSRDADLERAWGYLKLTWPMTALEALDRLIELEVLTTELDHAMTVALAQDKLEEASYAAAYRSVGRRDARQRQIDLVITAVESLEHTVRYPFIGPLLWGARGPAYAAGFGVLQNFFERGYDAFRKLGDPQAFLKIIRERETALMDALFSGRSNIYAMVETFPA